MAGEGRHAHFRRGWSNLPGDMLGMVYRRCCSSPYDRTRFAAVCSWWRAVVSWHPKLPALPLLLPLTGDANTLPYSLEDGRALRFPLRGFPWGKQLVGSPDGGWIAATTGTRLLIVNVFSGVQVPLSIRQSLIGCKHPRLATRVETQADHTLVNKIIFSDEPSSSHCLLAAITNFTSGKIALCRVGCPAGGWTTESFGKIKYEGLKDIAFCNKKLYGISYQNLLYKFDIDMVKNGPPEVTSVHTIEMGNLHECWMRCYERCLFELRGNLAIAMKFYQVSYSFKAPFYRVFELMDSAPTWVEVTSLGEHALFVGQSFCKTVHVPSIGGRSMLERNHIYNFEKWSSFDQKMSLESNNYTLYYGKSEGVHPSQKIKSWGYRYGHEGSSNSCIWILPQTYNLSFIHVP